LSGIILPARRTLVAGPDGICWSCDFSSPDQYSLEWNRSTGKASSSRRAGRPYTSESKYNAAAPNILMSGLSYVVIFNLLRVRLN
jgi:hypothetical protein